MLTPSKKKERQPANEIGHKSRFVRAFHRWKLALRKVTQETLDSLDDDDQGEATVQGLFCGNDSMLEKVASGDRDSGASMSPVGVSELNLTTSTEDSLNDHSVASSGDASDSAGKEDEEEEMDAFKKFDTALECAKLRKEEGEPFCGGVRIWERRRQLWTQPSPSLPDESDYKRRRDLFASIPKNYYMRIYKSLVLDDKPLREPLNLQDALQLINAGWIETRKWENAVKNLA